MYQKFFTWNIKFSFQSGITNIEVENMTVVKENKGLGTKFSHYKYEKHAKSIL